MGSTCRVVRKGVSETKERSWPMKTAIKGLIAVGNWSKPLLRNSGARENTHLKRYPN